MKINGIISIAIISLFVAMAIFGVETILYPLFYFLDSIRQAVT